jgi:hypothetical protein
MTNNTEQRKTSEQAPREAFEAHVTKTLLLGVDTLPDGQYESQQVRGLWLTWQAALAQREQEAPSLCTAEEAAELALHIEMTVSDMDITTFKNGNVHATNAGLAAIINADRAKR